MEQAKKELLLALVLGHVSSNKQSVVGTKSGGLTILLYGGPGTGKTLTVESLSELARTPLYHVTLGDIGTDPEDAEKYLDTVLYLGTKWNFFVLLDEASIFVEGGATTDLLHNAMVSVFLRVLSYYNGVVFLRCNAISTFDAAFKSRIRFTLYFPALEPTDRLPMWGFFIEGLRERGGEIEYEELKEGIPILSKHSLNGREIRDTIDAALSLASWKGEPLRLQHLLQVIDVTNEFEAHSMEPYGHDWT
jgi:Cdc6-like AAA superfamily ATPase